MSKLLDHFKAMQGMASLYLEPGPYTNRTGSMFSDEDAGFDKLRDEAFISDMIYMLDGPEQREAERWDAANQESLDEHEREMAEMRDKVAVANSDRERATKKLDVVKAENNDLRSRLHEAELAHAKLFGYVERIEDERPPTMVPEQRERFFYRMDSSGPHYRDPSVEYYANSARQPKSWYHR